jgi:hypothetical protein
MRTLFRLLGFVHGVLAVLFAIASAVLIAIAVAHAYASLDAGGATRAAAQQVIEALGLLTAAVVALQIAQTIAEEEVVREAHVSGPTRVRRFLSRFLVVIVVALAIESLVATFRAANEEPAQLLQAAGMVVAVGVLLAGWGVFLRLNRYAEELEPEAMQEAVREDKKLK